MIRLEFNQSDLGYYTELDAVILYGKPAHSDSHEESKSITEPNDSEVHLTANLFRQLSLSGKKTEGQDDLENNGYFDILPVGLLDNPSLMLTSHYETADLPFDTLTHLRFPLNEKLFFFPYRVS